MIPTILISMLAPASDAVDFRRDIAPVIERRCLTCHRTGNAKGGLSLETLDAALRGGEEGPALVPGKPADSLLWIYVSGDKPLMPKSGGKLAAAEVEKLRAWIAAGAPWPKDAVLKPSADAEWWSLRKLASPSAPPVGESGSTHLVDRHLDQTRKRHGLKPAPRASRLTLIRRATFDLHGLPPTPEEIDAFLADKRADDVAYAALLERLLASPRYGERWARHWLDLAGYAETHGYDKDQPRPNAWPYRDYVIRAFNEDKPYDRFVREQIAGDAAYPGTRDGVEALGFLAAGPWDLIGHAEVPETKIDGRIARHLDRDDMTARTMQAFVGMTVQCAQCHDHKFDPISQDDYYSLHAVFAAVDKADRVYDLDPKNSEARRRLQAELRRLETERQALEGKASSPEITRLRAELADVAGPTRPPAYGYHSALSDAASAAKWVQIDLGKTQTLDEIVLYPCDDDFAGIGPGFCFPVRYLVELSDDADFKIATTVADRTKDDQLNPKTRPVRIPVSGKSGRYLRITATKLAHRQNDYCFALAEVAAFDGKRRNLAAGKPVTAFDSIEAPIRWRKSNLTDGKYPTKKLTDAETAELQAKYRQAVVIAMAPTDSARWKRLETELDAAQRRFASIPPAATSYVASVYKGSGSFRGRGHENGVPRAISVLERGNVQKPLRTAGPGALSAVQGMTARFTEAQPDEAKRRLQLADWLTHREQPLTWRVIVNRVWRWHFGRGLVETPSDFGRMGETPSHPELLESLAAEFRDGPRTFKALHLLLMTSAAYCQSADPPGAEQAFKTDPDDRWHWRFRRRRLEAEALRDGMLQVAGKLDLRLGGPSFRDFVIEKPEHSPHYQYHLADPDDPKTHRRSIYRFVVRSQPQPLLAALACADPAQSVDRRHEGYSPPAALGLLNSAFTATMCKHAGAKFAARPDGVEAGVTRAVRECLGRPPTPAELDRYSDFARRHGFANLCRVLFNLNEFAFVD